MRKYLFYIDQIYSFAIVRPLQQAILARGDSVAWYFDNSKKLSSYLKSDEPLIKSVAEVMAYNPCAVFAPGNVVPNFFPGIKVDLFHGFNAKKRAEDRGHYRIRNFFDLYCTQGPATTLKFQALARQHRFFEVKETGWPKMDPLFSEQKTTDENHQQKTIFLASTFTERLCAAPRLRETIKELSKTMDWEWLVNFHPKMDPGVVRAYKAMQNDQLQYIETDNIIPLLKQADLMVSDTSSIISEFLLLDKPAVTFRNREPGPQLLDISEPEKLKETIIMGLSKPEALMAHIKSYCDQIHPYRDGQSSKRVLEATDKLVKTGLAHLKQKPLNLIRNFKLRKKLRYDRF